MGNPGPDTLHLRRSGQGPERVEAWAPNSKAVEGTGWSRVARETLCAQDCGGPSSRNRLSLGEHGSLCPSLRAWGDRHTGEEQPALQG